MPELEGIEVIREMDPLYESVRHVYSRTGRPAAVILPRSATEVSRALLYARSISAPLSIRSGGHGISSVATNDGGIVIDLRRLAKIERRDDARVGIGPGARWGAVADRLVPWGLALTSGDSGDVGVGGLATTGGIGLLGRSQGLTIDRIRRAQLVTSEGEVLSVAPDEHPDLFWAVRGAGANIGIVTDFEFEPGRTPVVGHGTFAYQIRRPEEFFSVWGRTVEDAPREISAFLYAGSGPHPFAQATVVFAGDDADAAARALAPFADLPRLVGSRGSLVPYSRVPLTSGVPHGGQQTAVMHSGLVTHLDAELSLRLASLLRERPIEMLQIRSAGGAINDLAPTATAYAHRHQNFSVAAVAARAGAAFDDVWRPVAERTDGLYLSFESDHRPDAVMRAFPPATLERLRRIKLQWDPDDVFSQNFDVSAFSP